MFPGLTSKQSLQILATAATIDPKADIIQFNDNSNAITTILAHFGPTFSGSIWVINNSGGNLTFNTGGNIAAAKTVPNQTMCLFTFVRGLGLWFPNMSA